MFDDSAVSIARVNNRPIAVFLREDPHVHRESTIRNEQDIALESGREPSGNRLEIFCKYPPNHSRIGIGVVVLEIEFLRSDAELVADHDRDAATIEADARKPALMLKWSPDETPRELNDV
jgi:hypothetical protein